MHSLACSPAERITVEYGMIFGVQSDTVQSDVTCTEGIDRKKISWLLRIQATSQCALPPTHINVGSIDVVTPSLIWHLEDDP